MVSTNQPLAVQVGAVGLGKKWLAVADLTAASRACREFIETHDLGASGWRGGRIIDAATNRAIANVAYNGRVWLADGTEVQISPTR